MRGAVGRAGDSVASEDRRVLQWTAHPIHGSLVRQRLYLGVERTVLALEGVVCLAVLFGVGLSLITVALLALVVAVMHPVMVWISADDPQATEIAVRSRAFADFYAPHAALRTSRTTLGVTLGTTPHADRGPRPRPSVPRAR